MAAIMPVKFHRVIITHLDDKQTHFALNVASDVHITAQRVRAGVGGAAVCWEITWNIFKLVSLIYSCRLKK